MNQQVNLAPTSTTLCIGATGRLRKFTCVLTEPGVIGHPLLPVVLQIIAEPWLKRPWQAMSSSHAI